MTGLVGVYITFDFKKPVKTSKITPSQDVDNCAKAILDALNGICYLDDKQCCELYASKRWADDNAIKVTIIKL